MPGCWRGWLVLVLAFCATAAAGAEREWTSADGRTMQAQFVREVDGEVTFLKDGKLVTIPLDRLSTQDQQIVRDLAAGRPVPDEPAENPFEPVENPFQSVAPDRRTGLATRPDDEDAADRDDADRSDSSGRSAPMTRRPLPIANRSWTDQRGLTFTAKFVRIHNGSVVLTRAGNRVVTIPFYSLTQQDQEYVREILESRGEESKIPPPPPPPRNDGDGGMAGGMAGGGGIGGGGIGGGGLGGGGFGRGGFGGGGFAGGPAAMPEPRFPSPPVGSPMRMPEPGFAGSSDAGSPHAGSSGGFGSGSMPDPSNSLERMRQQNEELTQRHRESVERMQQRAAESMQRTNERLQEQHQRMFPQSATAGPNDIVGECLSCKGKLTKFQASGSKCPHCRVTWGYEIDEFGRKKRLNAHASPFSGPNRVELDPETRGRIVRVALIVIIGLGVVFMGVFTVVLASVFSSSGPRRPRRYP